MGDFETIDRPAPRVKAGPRRSDVVSAIAETLSTGKAVRVPLNGSDVLTVRNRYRSNSRLRDAGAVRTRVDGDALVVWLEPK